MPTKSPCPRYVSRSSVCALALAASAFLCVNPAKARAQINFTGAESTLVGSGWNNPSALTVDSHGNLFVLNFFNEAYNYSDTTELDEIVAVNGSIPANATVHAVAYLPENGSGYLGIAVDALGDVYIANSDASAVEKLTAVNGSIPPNPTIETVASGFNFVKNGFNVLTGNLLAVDAAGDLFAADSGNDAVKEIEAVNGSVPNHPTIRTLGGSFDTPTGVAVDKSGDVFVSDGPGIQEIVAVNGSIPANPTVSTILPGYSGVAVDAAGDLFLFANYLNGPPYFEVLEAVAVDGKIPAKNPTILLLPGCCIISEPAVNAHGQVFYLTTTYGEESSFTVNSYVAETTAGITNSAAFDYNGSAGAPSVNNGSNNLLQLSPGNSDSGVPQPFFDRGSIFYADPVNITQFTSSFTFQLQADGSQPIADGITFTIQNAGLGALGSHGGGLGYEGIGKSVAVKFDTHDNAGEGPNSTGVYTNGEAPTVPAVDLEGTGIDLHSGHVFAAKIVYKAGNLGLTITDTKTGAVWSHTFSVNIPAVVGGDTAYVGFTGGTGDASSLQQVFTFSFTNP